MNTSNQRLLKGIKIFFKALYVIMIILLILTTLSYGVLLLSKEADLSVITSAFTIEHPTMDLKIDCEGLKIQEVSGIGAVIMTGAPFSLKLINSLYLIIVLFIYVIMIRIIRSIIRTIDTNEIFSLKNAHRLRNIGLFLLLSLILNFTLLTINTSLLFSVRGTGLSGVIGGIGGESSAQLVSMVFVFFMAAVFKIGANIQEENQSFV
jgi:hypothetical protein